MLIQDDALRSVIARTLRVKEEELTGSVTRVLGSNNATLTLNTTSGDIEIN